MIEGCDSRNNTNLFRRALDRAIGRMAESVTWAADGIAKLAKVEAAEIALANAVPQVICQHKSCVDHRCRRLHCGYTDASLADLLASWPNLPSHIIQAIIALVRASQG